MRYIIEQSLERSTLIKIVIALWNHRNIRDLIEEFSVLLRNRENRGDESFDHIASFKKEWQEIEDEVIKNASLLLLPNSLRKKISDFIRPVGFQILYWILYLIDCQLGVILPSNLCWKQQGTIDRKRTAELLMKDDSLDVSMRYQLACINCLKDDILELWNKMPENQRVSSCSNERQQDIITLWTSYVKGKLPWMHDGIDRFLDPRYLYQFECAAFAGNKVAAEYLIQKMTDKEREESLVATARIVARKACEQRLSSDIITNFRKAGYAEVLLFLLSQMDDEKQLQVFENCPCQVLECVLDWPWQDFFVETANHMWYFLSDHCYFLLLEIVVYKQLQSCNDSYYQQLFGEFWQQSLATHKRYVVHQCGTTGHLLSSLFKVEEKENIRMILKEANVEEKERIIFNGKGMLICERLIYYDKWDLLNFFVGECISPTNLMVRFSKELKEHVIRNYQQKLLNKKPNMWNELCHFLDDHIHNADNKRSIEEGDTNSSKKFCSAE